MINVEEIINLVDENHRSFVRSHLNDQIVIDYKENDNAYNFNQIIDWESLPEKEYIIMKKIYQRLVPDGKDDLVENEATQEIYTDLEPNNETINTQPHYKGKDSLYKFAEDWELNSYEFDIVKRIVRCRHKGNFEEDLEKTKKLIDIYLKEFF